MVLLESPVSSTIQYSTRPETYALKFRKLVKYVFLFVKPVLTTIDDFLVLIVPKNSYQ